MQLPSCVSKSEERQPDRLGQTEAQVSLGVQLGLLQLPSPRADWPGNEAIPEHGVLIHHAGLVQIRDRELLS